MRSHWLWKLKESVLINGMVLKDSPRRIVVIIVLYWNLRVVFQFCNVFTVEMFFLGADDDALEAALGLGDLASLTITNEADPLSYDVSLLHK